MKLRIIKDSKDEDYLKALLIYIENIKEDWRTNTNEISYWLDNYNKTFIDKFYILGIYNESVLIGFLQFAHFIKDEIIFIDYITIDEKYRINNTFSLVIKEFYNFLDSNKFLHKYLICEVENGVNNNRSLVRLYNRFGFKKFDINYEQPILNIDDDSLSKNEINHTPYALMVKCKSLEVSKEEYLDIINIIYINHYKRWYTEFLTVKMLKDYTNHIDSLKDTINKKLKNINIVKII